MISSWTLPSARLRLRRRVARISGEGGMRKMETAPGILARICACPLHVDVEQEVAAPGKSIGQSGACRAVVVAEDVGIFEKLAVADHLLEMLAGGEVVFARVLLRAASSPRGPGDGKLQSRNQRAELVDESRFARPGGSRNDEENSRQSLLFLCVQKSTAQPYSKFCTCSRAFSISDFIPSPASVIRVPLPATPLVFESRVLASRFISCSRKSSFFPTSPP